MEYGYYSPSTGDYWQTTGEVPDKYKQNWPKDYIQLPSTRPSGFHVWDAEMVTWVEHTPTPHPKDYPLARWQFHAMVDMLGKRQAIESAIEGLPDPAARAVATAKLKHSHEFNREDHLVISLSAAVGISPDELDSAWLQAKDLT
jgi:hypothetical protein